MFKHGGCSMVLLSVINFTLQKQDNGHLCKDVAYHTVHDIPKMYTVFVQHLNKSYH